MRACGVLSSPTTSSTSPSSTRCGSALPRRRFRSGRWEERSLASTMTTRPSAAAARVLRSSITGCRETAGFDEGENGPEASGRHYGLTTGVYVNFLMDEGQDRVREGLWNGRGDERLKALKRRYDPQASSDSTRTFLLPASQRRAGRQSASRAWRPVLDLVGLPQGIDGLVDGQEHGRFQRADGTAPAGRQGGRGVWTRCREPPRGCNRRACRRRTKIRGAAHRPTRCTTERPRRSSGS